MEVLIFIVGAAGYAGVEYLYRGYTHWTMVLTGGACLLAFYCYTKETKDTPLLVQAAAGACIVTVFEFCVGVVVNLWYGWHVWDYSREPGNLLGHMGLYHRTAESAGADLPVVFLYMVSAVPHHPHAFFCFRFMV